MPNKKKVALIGTNGIPARYGGFETLTEYLARYLSDKYEITVYCAKSKKTNRLQTYLNSKLVYIPFKANGWQSMIYDALSIIHAFIKSDVLVILGFSGVFAFPLKPIFKKKVVFNIGGIEWQKVRGTKIFGPIEVATKKWFEKICVAFSDKIIVDNQVLWDYVKLTYNINSTLAEYGGDHAIFKPITEELANKYTFLKEKYDLTVSRAQEDMNIHLLIEAYKKMPNRNLVVVSNWWISDYGIKLKEDNKDKFNNIYLVDAVYDLEELNTIRSNGIIYFHTHSLCGTAPSLTEAMSLGLAIICFDVETNRSTTEDKSYYFKDANSLIEILNEISEDELHQLKIDMHEIAQRRYTWARIVQIYNNCIKY